MRDFFFVIAVEQNCGYLLGVCIHIVVLPILADPARETNEQEFLVFT